MKHDMLASRSPSRTPKSRLMVCTAIKTINLLTYLPSGCRKIVSPCEFAKDGSAAVSPTANI